MNKLTFYISFIFLFLCYFGFSQENTLVEVKNIKGQAYDSDIITSREKAINDAKVNALRKAGIGENINSYADYFRAETDEKYQELFSSQVFSQIKGVVKDYEIIDENKTFTDSENIKTEVVINCKILKYNNEPDLLYKAAINEILPVYYDGDALNFSVKVSKDSYLKVFCIPESKEDAYFLFPNEFEKNFLLKADLEYKFPMEVEKYEMVLDTRKQQIDRFIFVFTKEDYPYFQEITYSNITNWIFDIPIEKRIVESFAINIYSK